ncbi:hypothetical protein pEaSNUABM11_00155 [Erwinia phage pEa_SNUABM_11]|nr:hypothetical protein pEaSNUABM11_00155 [Erwinia phage pEa_SNUABM_11]
MGIVRVVRVPVIQLRSCDLKTEEERTRYGEVSNRGEKLVEELKKEGHPVEWYPLPYLPSIRSNMAQALTATSTLAVLQPNSEEAVVLYRALERTFKEFGDKTKEEDETTWLDGLAIISKHRVEVTRRFLQEHGDPVANKPGWYRHNPIQSIKEKEVTVQPWEPGVRKGFDRSVRRPQSHFPVLTIELPNGKPPAGVREDIAEHLRLIGYAVKFKN